MLDPRGRSIGCVSNRKWAGHLEQVDVAVGVAEAEDVLPARVLGDGLDDPAVGQQGKAWSRLLLPLLLFLMPPMPLLHLFLSLLLHLIGRVTAITGPCGAARSATCQGPFSSRPPARAASYGVRRDRGSVLDGHTCVSSSLSRGRRHGNRGFLSAAVCL